MTNPYTGVNVSANYNSDAPPDDGTEVPENEVEWQKNLDKIGDPLKTAFESMDANVTTAFDSTINIDIGEQNSVAGVIGYVTSALTIIGGSVTPVNNIHSIRGASASADNLAAMANGGCSDGTIVTIHAGSDSEVITVKHEDGAESGNIHLAGRADIVLDSTKKHLQLRRNGTDWYEVASGANFADGYTTMGTTDIDAVADLVPIYDKDADEWKNTLASTFKGSWEKISSVTAAADATITITGMDVSGIDLYRITWGGVYTASAGTMHIRFGDGSGIISSSSYHWADVSHDSATAGAVDSESGAASPDAEIVITGTAGNVDSEMHSGVMYCTGFGAAANNASCHWKRGGHNSGNIATMSTGVGIITIAPASGTWDQVQFLVPGGTYTEGEFTLEKFNR